jgi:hypothetical protein
LVQNLPDDVLKDLNEHASDQHYWKLSSKGRHHPKISTTTLPGGLGTEFSVKFSIVQTECLKDRDRQKIELNLCSVRDDAPRQVKGTH